MSLDRSCIALSHISPTDACAAVHQAAVFPRSLMDDAAAFIQEQAGSGCLLVGVYSSAERALFPGQSRSLDWNGALTLFTIAH